MSPPAPEGGESSPTNEAPAPSTPPAPTKTTDALPKPSSADTTVPPSLGSGGSQSELDADAGGRSRRHSPIVAELQSIVGDEECRSYQNITSTDIFPDGEDLVEFVPKLGVFGAPACRLTTSVLALLGILAGMVFVTAGACILVFFIDEEPTIIPLGVTLVAVGGLLTAIGLIMWCSEFMCNDCLALLYYRMKEAPMKNAIKRRSRMAASRTSNARLRASQCGSRSSVLSYRTSGSEKTVSTKY